MFLEAESTADCATARGVRVEMGMRFSGVASSLGVVSPARHASQDIIILTRAP
jgi:hypothetical protein